MFDQSLEVRCLPRDHSCFEEGALTLFRDEPKLVLNWQANCVIKSAMTVAIIVVTGCSVGHRPKEISYLNR